MATATRLHTLAKSLSYEGRKEMSAAATEGAERITALEQFIREQSDTLTFGGTPKTALGHAVKEFVVAARALLDVK